MARCLIILILCAGCDVLFPEFAGKQPMSTPDGGAADGMTDPEIQGSLCILQDVRDPRTCTSGVPSGMHVTVEETRDAAPVDATGHFTLPLSMALDSATFAAADPSGTFLPTITTLRLQDGRATGVVVPVVRAELLRQDALSDGVGLDDQKGILLGWLVDGQGNAIQGASASLPGSDGPFYDGPQAGEVAASNATGAHGLIAFYNVAPESARLSVAGTVFELPIRPNAATLSLLVTTTH